MKRLIVCSDGTWSTPEKETNVYKMWRAIGSKDKHGNTQKAFYDEGVGTEGNWVERLLGGASGVGLDKNIQDGYRFLMHTYEPDDKIYLFGYSRGAYTVRSLAGFLRNCGLLHMNHADKVKEAFDLYRRKDAPPWSDIAKEFRADYSQEVDIEFIGVWDTVGALGIPTKRFGHILNRRYHFHDVELSGRVKHGYHALAIDERRRPFRPAIWGFLDDDDKFVVYAERKDGQAVDQAWFTGYHGDVGGGTDDDRLSDVTFEWIMRKAYDTDLRFDTEYLASHLHPDPLGKDHDSSGKLPWKLPLLNSVRSLGTTWHTTEALHASVLKRQEELSYNPDNLVEYQESGHDRVVKTPAAPEGAVPPGLGVS